MTEVLLCIQTVFMTSSMQDLTSQLSLYVNQMNYQQNRVTMAAISKLLCNPIPNSQEVWYQGNHEEYSKEMYSNGYLELVNVGFDTKIKSLCQLDADISAKESFDGSRFEYE